LRGVRQPANDETISWFLSDYEIAHLRRMFNFFRRGRDRNDSKNATFPYFYTLSEGRGYEKEHSQKRF